MGLILAALSAAGSTARDQWKEYFYCDALPADVIAVQGHKKTSGFSSNAGNDNVITNGSMIVVADGQCMVIVEQGQVVEICAEPGEFKYDNTIAPSIFTGNLGDSIKQVFAELGKRFEFGGQPAQDQRVYYFNTKELIGNKYGTPAPVPFRVVDKNTGLDVDISVKCFGEYSYKVVDPITFYTKVCGNFRGEYRTDALESAMKTELLQALQPAFAKISEQGIRYSSLPGHTTELCEALKEELSVKWRELRGIEIVSIGVASIKADEKDEERLKNAQFYANANLAASQTQAAHDQAIKDAANNAAGAGVGFMNVNMAQQAGGGASAADLFTIGAQQKAAETAAAPKADTWICPKCGKENDGNFCSNCGETRPGTAKWICPTCGKENDGNFCGTCGTKKPE